MGFFAVVWGWSGSRRPTGWNSLLIEGYMAYRKSPKPPGKLAQSFVLFFVSFQNEKWKMAKVWKKFSSHPKVEKLTVIMLRGAANDSPSAGVPSHPNLGSGIPGAGAHLSCGTPGDQGPGLGPPTMQLDDTRGPRLSGVPQAPQVGGGRLPEAAGHLACKPRPRTCAEGSPPLLGQHLCP